MKQSQIRRIRRGSSKTSWIVCSPTSTARQPCPSSSNAELIGYRESSDVASTRARVLTSIQDDSVSTSSRFIIHYVFLICLQFGEACDSRSLLIQSPGATSSLSINQATETWVDGVNV